MQKPESLPPLVSFVIPVLNAAGILGNCLASIRRQDYPQDRIEVIVADGGSSDESRSIAASYGAIILDNPLRGYDTGKSVALARAAGEFIVFVDADNELTHTDFLSLAIMALRRYPDALGLESYYLSSPKMASFCIYLSQLLHISDPIARMMSIDPELVARDGEIERWTFPPDSLAWPMGANGFVFRKADLDSTAAMKIFEDTHVALELARAGRREWLRITGRGVHHYVVGGVGEFLKKRRRQAYHFLSLKEKNRDSWTNQNPRMPGWAACLVCATLVVPVAQTIRNLIKTGDWHWLWHPVACLASVTGVVWGVATYVLSERTADAEARLQPVQKITKQP